MSNTGDQPPHEPAADATQILDRIAAGEDEAAEELFPLVYAELRARAGAYFRGQPGRHTLQPTGLVHEAFLKLVRSPQQDWQNRTHFCAVASRAMRQILVDYARRRQRAAADRADRQAAITELHFGEQVSIDVLDLEEALQELAEHDASAVRLVELRFFGGMALDELAATLDCSIPTLKREWRAARAWLRERLRGGEDI